MINISGYKFVPLTNLENWQLLCRQICQDFILKGTVAWSPEGINVMLAGEEQPIRDWVNWLKAFAEFKDIEFKFSESEHQPFGKMLVKIKKALVPGAVNPLVDSAPAIKPAELKRWYETQKDFVIIDTRNHYEVKLGHFKNALDIDLETFSEFPQKMAALPQALKQKPLVVYCTGGIRCEKAAPLAKQAGFKEVYQLEGGILKYFEECENAFYEGDCFVFDERVALKKDLHAI